ncbi:LOW QUALITY PROTEIN: hypothetical protein V2J09_007221 [Rumex salicifolius]
MTIARYGRQAKSVFARWSHQLKRPHGLCSKLTAVVVLGLCFVLLWSFFSATPKSLEIRRESFGEIAEPTTSVHTPKVNTNPHPPRTQKHAHQTKSSKNTHSQSDLSKKKKKKKKKKPVSERANKGTDTVSVTPSKSRHDFSKESHGDKLNSTEVVNKEGDGLQRSEDEEVTEKDKDETDVEEEELVVDGKEEGSEASDVAEGDEDSESRDEGLESDLKGGDESSSVSDSAGKNKKNLGPVFDPKASYSWKLCTTRSKHNYIPCIDFEMATGKILMYRHHERSCPRTPSMCLVPLPSDGYVMPLRWPESKHKILYKNVAHPKLDAYIMTQSWVVESDEYLTFPQNESVVKGGISHYLESIEEMAPDIEWGKNIRVVLDVGCTDSSFGALLLDKNVVTLSLGLKDDLVDLAQLALERGFPAFVSPFASRRLPFPSNVFDAIHCGGCNIHWHSNGGKLLLEMNRVLRPGGYFIMSTKHNTFEREEAMTSLTASLCWNVLADKADEDSEVGIKIYQKPESNEIFYLRRKRNPPLCKETENPDAAWRVPLGNCLLAIPSALEQHGNEWPTEWPKRLETYPEWLEDKEKVKADTKHWNDTVEKSYLTGMGIDWRNIRNVMDMKSIYGGFAAALSQHEVWVMNVVPVHAPDTLPYIFERGLFGVYHDWCESFGTYPRTYDLLHADHLFARLKGRCRYPVGIVVEMDRILRPGGWAIVRDKVEIVDPLEGILRSLNWEIRMTFAQGKEGILVAQKTIQTTCKLEWGVEDHCVQVKLDRFTRKKKRWRQEHFHGMLFGSLIVNIQLFLCWAGPIGGLHDPFISLGRLLGIKPSQIPGFAVTHFPTLLLKPFPAGGMSFALFRRALNNHYNAVRNKHRFVGMLPTTLSSSSSRLTILALLSATTVFCFYKSLRLRSLKQSNSSRSPSRVAKILCISQTGTTKNLANRLQSFLSSQGFGFDLIDVQDYDPEDLVKENLVLILACTWEDGKAPPSARFFADWIDDSVNDFRVGSLLLTKCKFAVFGVGSRAYGENFNAVARGFSKKLKGLGAKEMLLLGEGDVDEGQLDMEFDAWGEKLVKALKSGFVENGASVCGSVECKSDCEASEVSESEDEEEATDTDIVDLEDLAGKGPSRNSKTKFEVNGVNGQKEMVTPVIRANLEKQFGITHGENDTIKIDHVKHIRMSIGAGGYKIIGSHSGVKLCRWTKAQLRGRGGCYKHSFYGIESHRCMETTPSLACANKCVFCWRHHTNPVGKNWQWKMDDPIVIVNTAIELHTKMIKQMKGVPGVKEERLAEGLSPRHCALSLVGEPIMYPEINTLLDELHRRRISSFLLYVSVDAATKDSLKAIDRPLFGDFWERFLDSLKALKDKQQRTVYRLTLVKGWNTEDLEAYFNLFSIGKPDFIEIKGVTYCGSTATSKLTMENVPWHADVKEFSEALASKSEGEYEVACEHAHSCCVLLAKTNKFKVNGQWHTWIDYEKFHDLVASGQPFSSEDYMAATPSWAVYGAEESGFDPDQTRYKKERRHNR